MNQPSALNTFPRKRDTDGDKLPDGWEVEQGFDPLVNNDTDSDPDNDADADPDGDGLTDSQEIALKAYWPGLAPLSWDTDGDKLPDGWEYEHGFDPLVNNDTDSDPDNCVKLRAVCAKNSNYKILHVLA